jgi:hypothetical protein
MARRGLLTVLLTAATLLVVAVPADMAYAQRQPPGNVGQQPQPRRGLLEMLFGPRIIQPAPQVQRGLFGQPRQPGVQQQRPIAMLTVGVNFVVDGFLQLTSGLRDEH